MASFFHVLIPATMLRKRKEADELKEKNRKADAHVWLLEQQKQRKIEQREERLQREEEERSADFKVLTVL